MAVYRVELALEKAQSCRAKPIALLALAIERLGSGDELVVEGEDFYYRHDQVVDLLREAGLEIVDDEYDGFTYRIRARRPGER